MWCNMTIASVIAAAVIMLSMSVGIDSTIPSDILTQALPMLAAAHELVKQTGQVKSVNKTPVPKKAKLSLKE